MRREREEGWDSGAIVSRGDPVQDNGHRAVGRGRRSDLPAGEAD